MLIWRGGAGSSGTFVESLPGFVISILLGDGQVTAGASPKSAYHEQPVQISQGVRRNTWWTQHHASADTGIEHPVGEHRYDARFDLDMQNAAAGTLFAVLRSKTPAMERVPTIVNFNFLPDMGRMIG